MKPCILSGQTVDAGKVRKPLPKRRRGWQSDLAGDPIAID